MLNRINGRIDFSGFKRKGGDNLVPQDQEVKAGKRVVFLAKAGLIIESLCGWLLQALGAAQRFFLRS